MATVRSIITQTLRRLNAVSANQAPTDDDVAVCQEGLNTLIDSLSNDILNIHTITPHRFLLNPLQQTYKLGPALAPDGSATNADWVIDRPMRIENAVLLLYPTVTTTTTIGQTSSTLFLPLMLANYSQYSDLTVRAIQSTWPTQVYDNGAYPVRELSFWPVPQNAYAVELWLWQPLATYDSLDDELNLPPGYERYLVLKLAMEMAPEFGKTVTDTLKATLTEAENAVKTLNQQVTKTSLSSAARRLAGGKAQTWMAGSDAPYNLPRMV